MHSGIAQKAFYKMADQFTAGVDGALEANDNDSRKRPLEQSGDGRQSYKRSNLGGESFKRSNCGRACEYALLIALQSVSQRNAMRLLSMLKAT